MSLPRTLGNVNSIHHLHSPHISHKHLPARPPGLRLWSDTREKMRTRLKGTQRTGGQELTLPLYIFIFIITPKQQIAYTRLILDLMSPLVNRSSPLTHASHCMTTSWSAAATQTRVRVSTAMHHKVFLCRMLFLAQPSLFPIFSDIANFNKGFLYYFRQP